MTSKPLIVFFSAALIGAVAFVLTQFSDVRVGKEGVSVKVGAPEAQAGCYQDGPNCLPQMDFVDIEGTVWKPEQLANKVVVINFWATWCKPCQHEVPALATVYRKYKDKDVVLLGLMSDTPSDAQLATFTDQFGLDYPVVRVSDEIREAFGAPRNLPTNFVYDRTGTLVFDRPGAVTALQLESEIKRLL